jgi:hypothetical protein
MRDGDLGVVLLIFLVSWAVCGVPSLIALWVVGLLAKWRRVHRMGFLKHVRLWMVALGLPLVALLFGLATGYWAAWTDDSEPRWYEFPAIIGAPGDAMANSYGGDWQDGEAWEYRSDISIWNGLFWTSVAFPAIFVLRGIFRQNETPDLNINGAAHREAT